MTEVNHTCPSCNASGLEPFYEIMSVPVHSCLMLSNEEESTNFPRGDVRLAFCNSCGFITNLLFDSKWSAYAPNYEDQQSFSPTFNSFAGKLAMDLVNRYNLKDKALVEIGCSKGDFLALLCEAGKNTGVGIDPSALPGRVETEARDRLRFIQDYYKDEHVDIKADFLCCRHTLEHIQPVYDFVGLIRKALAHNPAAPVMLEIPDTMRVLNEAAFEDIYYEHCSYFTPGTLASLIRRHGFAAYDLRLEYDDQYLVIEFGMEQDKNRKFDIEDSLEETKGMVSTFRSKIDTMRGDWSNFISGNKAHGKKVAIWGSGSKCVAFLSTLKLEDSVETIVDINPNRHGKFIPGLGKSISSPASLKEVDPDVIIVMNRIYEDEISADLKKMGVEARVVSVGGENLDLTV